MHTSTFGILSFPSKIAHKPSSAYLGLESLSEKWEKKRALNIHPLPIDAEVDISYLDRAVKFHRGLEEESTSAGLHALIRAQIFESLCPWKLPGSSCGFNLRLSSARKDKCL